MSTEIEYQIRPDINIHYISQSNVTLSFEDKSEVFTDDIFEILLFFRDKITLNKLTNYLSSIDQSKEEIVTAFTTINHLITNGFIANSASTNFYNKYHQSTDGWEKQIVHKEMLDDTIRTNNFKHALERFINPDSVVLDIGCGTGVLSLFAAKAGAKKVYSIEASKAAFDFSTNMVKDNNLEDKITLFNNVSYNVTIPEKADILVSEIIGNLPLGENILETFDDAKKRFLKPGAIIIPNNLVICAVPIHLHQEEYDENDFTQAEVNRWNENYDLKFDSLYNSKFNKTPLYYLDPKYLKNTTVLGKAVEIERFNFSEPYTIEHIENTIAFEMDRTDLEFNAILISFESQLSDLEAHKLNTDPNKAYPKNSWKFPIYALDAPLDLNKIKAPTFHVASEKVDRASYTFTLKGK